MVVDFALKQLMRRKDFLVRYKSSFLPTQSFPPKMPLILFPILVLSFLTICCCSALILPQLPSTLPLLNDTSNLTIPLTQNGSNYQLGVIRYQCQAARFGSNLNTESCWEAFGKMPAGPSMEDMHTYAPRDSQLRSDVKLPLRYLSDDGECAIDIGYNGPNQAPSVDETSDAVLEYNVGRLMTECVKNGVGASVSQFGKSWHCLGLSDPSRFSAYFLSRRQRLETDWTHSNRQIWFKYGHCDPQNRAASGLCASLTRSTPTS